MGDNWLKQCTITMSSMYLPIRFVHCTNELHVLPIRFVHCTNELHVLPIRFVHCTVHLHVHVHIMAMNMLITEMSGRHGSGCGLG